VSLQASSQPCQLALARISSLCISSPVALAGLPAFNSFVLKADALFCYSLGKEQLAIRS